jgi:signal transduction histidine kinase
MGRTTEGAGDEVRRGEEQNVNVARADGDRASVDRRYEEHEHEIRAALFGIETAAHALGRQRERLLPAQRDELAAGLMAEVRRLRALLEGRNDEPSTFDLADAIAPAIASACSSGLDVHSSVSRGIKIHGRRDCTTQVVLALLDSARQHAAPSPVEIRASVLGRSIVLYVEDRGTTITGRSRERMFERGGDEHAAAGLGLATARRLMVEQGGSLTFRVRPGGGASLVARFPRATDAARGPRGPRVCPLPQ